MARPFGPKITVAADDSDAPPAVPSPVSSPVPLGGTRAQAVQRLQVGLAGIFGTLMLVGLVDLIETRAAQTDATAVPEAVATNAPIAAPKQADPLVEAGVVPDLPATATPDAAPSTAAPILPERGGNDDLRR